MRNRHARMVHAHAVCNTACVLSSSICMTATNPLSPIMCKIPSLAGQTYYIFVWLAKARQEVAACAKISQYKLLPYHYFLHHRHHHHHQDSQKPCLLNLGIISCSQKIYITAML